ncbi:MAG TPA: UbiA family prenyltransferase [Planctomycetota bacterium]|nr:UbiA family prenyltransferase [Planctomycetota bacterium]
MIADLLRLVRAPLVATAIADGVAGYLLATVRVATEVGGHAPALLHDAPDPRPLAFVLVASTGLYWGGMALNDYFDLERDRRLYPFRPLPSGKVAPGLALGVGLALLATGVGAAWLGGGLLAGGFALLVALSVLAYDGLLKRFRLPGALGMGLCRTGNIFMAAATARAHAPLGVEGLAPFYALQAVGIGIYIFSVTLLSTFEEEDAPAAGIALGFAGVLAVPVVLALSYPSTSGIPFFSVHAALAVALAVAAFRKGTKATGHTTTRWLLRGLLLLDAGSIAAAGYPIVGAAALVALIVPNLFFARLLFSRGRPSGKPSTAR